METTKATAAKTIETLVEGETLVVRIRKILADKKNPAAGFKVSMEVAEIVHNPDRPQSALGDLNAGDARFDAIKQKPQRAFVSVMPAVAFEKLGISKESFDKLELSTGIDSKLWKEGQHFETVNILNPRLDGKRLRMQINESTAPSANGNNRAKINPATGVAVTHKGAAVYRNTGLVYDGTVRHSFLQSDNTIAAGIPDAVGAKTQLEA